MHCTSPCNTGGCPAEVLFGGTPGTVVNVARDFIHVIAPPHANGIVDVTVRIAGRPPATQSNAFYYEETSITTRADYVRYLVPIVARDVPGALSSLWRSELTLLNASAFDITPAEHCPLMHCHPQVYERDRALQLELPRNFRGDGTFLYLPRLLREDVALALRVRDVSREAEGWGTELPLVPEEEFAQEIQLIDVPLDARYRATLRVYGSERALLARVSVFLPDSNTPVSQHTFSMQPGSDAPFPDHPTYLQLDPLTPQVRAAAAAAEAHFVRIKVEVLPLSEVDDTFHETIWAFVSITNNVTQHVTNVTPHRAR